MKYCHNFPVLALIILSLFSGPVFSAQVNPVSESKVKERIKAVEETKDMDEQVKKRLLELYGKILNHLESTNNNNQQSEAFVNARKQAPEKIKLLEEKLAQQESKHEQRVLETQVEKTPEQILAEIKIIPLAELEQQLNSEAANLAAVMAKNADYEDTLNREINSAPDIRKRIVEANRLLEQLQGDKTLLPADSNAEANKAQQWLLDAHIASLRSEIKMLDLKLLSQPSRLKTLKLNVDLSDYNVKSIENQITQLKQQVDLKRSSEIQQTEEITRTEQSEAQGKHPLIQSLAKDNSQLSDTITQRTKKLIEMEAADNEVFKETQYIKDQQDNTRKKLEIAGLNQILGQVLWEQKKALPDSRQYINNLEKREHSVAQLGLEHIQYQEQLEKVKDREDYLPQLLVDIAPETRAIIQDDVLQLLKTRKTLLEKVITIDEKYLKALSELDFAEKELIDVAESYAQLLDQHLFWLRSASILNLDNLKEIPGHIKFLIQPGNWFSFANDFFTISRSSYQVIPGFLLFIFLLYKRSRIKELLINTGHKTKKISTDSLRYTLKAIFYTFLLAIPVPLILWLGVWQLANIPEVSPFSHAVAQALSFIVFPLFSLIIFRYMCYPGGLFEVHFKWSQQLIKGLRKEMGRLMLTFLPIIFITTLLISKGESSISGGLGRLFLLLTLTTFALFFYRLLKPKSGFLAPVVQNNPSSLYARYQTLAFLLDMLLIASLMVLTIIGYVYLAIQMTALLTYSIWFVFLLVLLQQLSVRWLLLTRRRYALKMAYEKRQAAHALKQEQEQHKQDSSDIEDNESVIEIEEPEIDMVSLSKDSQKLLNLALFVLTVSGFIFIWSDVLPALSIFEKITLWHHEGVMDGATKLIPVTLGDLSLAILILILTFVGAKRFPAIIEILLLQNDKISSGDRYTITTLLNYTIIGVGIFITIKMLGADWNRLQWLFAALSVGIGFGLQEIVANFISGLIILFERPIRVGDFISVGDNEGVVSRIQIRATTITTYDRKELLVPNKEFITGQLINLSLTDPIARIIIPIGVAYGSDIPKARELLLQCANNNERVLQEPVPRVVFHSFGDNSLNLELRCFIGNVDNRMSTISEINEAVNDKFNAADICIAFPQRDIHLDINHPIDIRMQGKKT